MLHLMKYYANSVDAAFAAGPAQGSPTGPCLRLMGTMCSMRLRHAAGSPTMGAPGIPGSTPMNRSPLEPVTAEHIETYRRDGVVLIRNMLDAEWLRTMQQAIAEVTERPAEFGVLGPSHGAMTSVCFMWRKPGAFRDYVFNSPIGEVVGRVIGANSIRVYHDHLFVKPPRSPKIMQWHCDETAWPVRGEMAPNIWTAFSPVNAENGRIEYVAGFHRHCVERGLHFGFRPDQARRALPRLREGAQQSRVPVPLRRLRHGAGRCRGVPPAHAAFLQGERLGDRWRASASRCGSSATTCAGTTRATRRRFRASRRCRKGQPPEGEQFPVIWRRSMSAAA